MQFPICPKPEMREYEAEERGGTQSDTLGHKVQKGNVKWLLKYAKFETSNSYPISKPTKPMLSKPFIAKIHCQHRKNTKETAIKEALGIQTRQKIIKLKVFCSFFWFLLIRTPLITSINET